MLSSLGEYVHINIQVHLCPLFVWLGLCVYCLCRNDLIHILQTAAAALELLSSLTSRSTIKTQQPTSAVLHSTAPITTLGKGRLIKNINCKPIVGKKAHTSSQNYTHVGYKRQNIWCVVLLLNHMNRFLNSPQMHLSPTKPLSHICSACFSSIYPWKSREKSSSKNTTYTNT